MAVALKGEADELLESEVDVCSWVSLGKLGRMIETFQKAQVTEVAMAGAVAKTKLFSKIRPDWKAVRLLAPNAPQKRRCNFKGFYRRTGSARNQSQTFDPFPARTAGPHWNPDAAPGPMLGRDGTSLRPGTWPRRSANWT